MRFFREVVQMTIDYTPQAAYLVLWGGVEYLKITHFTHISCKIRTYIYLQKNNISKG